MIFRQFYFHYPTSTRWSTEFTQFIPTNHSEKKLQLMLSEDIGIISQEGITFRNILNFWNKFKFLMPKRDEILIIGNGRSVLDNSFGEKINQFPVVGRINNYSIIEILSTSIISPPGTTGRVENEGPSNSTTMPLLNLLK